MADSNKIITLITGASSGIGLELAAQLAADSNNHVLLCSRTLEKGEKALQEVLSRKLEGTVELLQVDVASEDSINAAAKNVEEKYGRLVTPDHISQ
ncbi:hypothetical protein PRZ48_013528 [Zasmidium cellare]|uniref:Uncharacterized protein n=1 Tax=Zasmidium cellare TaxID=395010 RepID=A0ABR0E1U2_ZASCE|nr:hypothetical protein PRZ48_013528 [Zasmidium cellare]